MRLFKLLVTLLILCLIGIFIYQNLQTWTQQVGFKLDLKLLKTSPSLELYLLILISALVGFIIGFAILLKPYFRTRRLLKRERQERKQEQDEFNIRQAESRSRAEADHPSEQTDQGTASEKEE